MTDFDIRPGGQGSKPVAVVRHTPVISKQERSTRPNKPSRVHSTGGGIITAASKRGRSGKRWLAGLDIALTAIVAVTLVLFTDTMLIAGASIAAYAIYIGVRRVGGRLPFALALLAILGVVVHFTFIPDPELVNTYAMYVFFLLVIGTIALALELPHKV